MRVYKISCLFYFLSQTRHWKVCQGCTKVCWSIC